jgi:hypothetical protein
MRTAFLASLLLLPLTVGAQVYSWKDASGKMHYGDQPPADRGVQTRRVGAANTTSPAQAAPARPSAAEQRLDAKLQDKEAAEQKAKAERERMEEERRQQDCQRARNAMQGIESGRVRFRLGADGEREALEDAARDDEMNRLQQAVEASCTPRPASAGAKKK